MQKSQFRKTLMASVITSVSIAGFSAPTFAQDVEEVLVTGIRASLERSMDVKRNSAGVVDAISSQDIGKFPDTNLAESLQRITGVSIDRNNGEGSRITVRGFGPDNNMVTLNGRTMPGGTAYGGGSGADASTRGGNSRAFDFANLASESVAGVEVYKTGKANITGGGIGATVNIKTTRPLELDGFVATIGAKAVMDTTNRTGDDITPEFSGMVGWADDDGVFGVSLSASVQKRDSGFTGATVNDWAVAKWGSAESQTLYDIPANSTVFENAPDVDGLYARPNDVRHTFSDRERERTNAQLTFQYRPVESVTATLDYTFAQNDQTEHRGEVTTWLANGDTYEKVEFDNGTIKVPVFISENYGTGRKDVGLSQYYRAQEDTLESLGLNVSWAVNDQFTLSLDAHDSTMESLPTGPGRAGELDIGLGANVKSGATWNFSGRDIPSYTNTIDGELDPSDISSSVMRVFSVAQFSDVTQVKVDGQWEFSDDSRFDFGIERSEISSNTVSYNGNNEQVLGGWGASNPGEFPDDLFTPFNVAGAFDSVSPGNSPSFGYRADARELAAHLVSIYPNAYVGVEDTQIPGQVRNSKSNNLVEEDTDAAYFQFASKGTLAGLEMNVLAGLRYETTKQTSSSNTPPVAYYVWTADNDFSVVSAPAGTPSIEKNSYDVLLPNLDVSLNLTDDIVARFSFGKTMARPGLGQLGSAVNYRAPNGSTLNAGTTIQADGQNPQLKPLESTNFDMSLEWYFDDASYVSAGIFEKRVANFTGTEIIDRTFDVRDQTSGPRARAARDALNTRSINVDNSSLYAMMQILSNPTAYPQGADAYTDTLKETLNSQVGYDPIVPNADDPLMVYKYSAPVNNREAKIHGAEFGVQHFFGDTGFGVQANYTIVRGDVKFDNLNITDTQFSLLGLSDTANIVLMYENNNIEARVAYNWRDKFLNRTGAGANNPGYIEAYSQIDANVTYHISENLSVSLEGINLTGEDRREHARNKNMLWGYDDLGARYQLGARYNF